MSVTVESVSEFYNAFLSATDLEKFLNDYATDDVVWVNFLPENIPFGGSFEGKSEYARYLTILLEAIEMKSFDIDHILVDGNKAVVFGSETSDVRANGKSYTMDWVHEVHFTDGKVSYAREYNDTSAMRAAFAA